MSNIILGELDTLVFEGGGIKGIALLGALKCLEKNGLDYNDIKYFVGTSIGSIISFLLVIGFKSTEILDILFSENLSNLCNDNPIFYITNIFYHNGLNSGNKLVKFFEDILVSKNFKKDITLQQLYDITGKVLVTTGTSLTDKQTYYFNAFSLPNMTVVDSIRISMSIPLYFTPIKYTINDTLHCFVDGAVLCNYPIYYIDICKRDKRFPLNWNNLEFVEDNFSNKSLKTGYPYQSLGIVTDTFDNKGSKVGKSNSDLNFKSFLTSILNVLIETIDKYSLSLKPSNIEDSPHSYKTRTIIITLPSDVSAINFNLKPDEIKKIFELGYTFTKKYCKKLKI